MELENNCLTKKINPKGWNECETVKEEGRKREDQSSKK